MVRHGNSGSREKMVKMQHSRDWTTQFLYSAAKLDTTHQRSSASAAPASGGAKLFYRASRILAAAGALFCFSHFAAADVLTRDALLAQSKNPFKIEHTHCPESLPSAQCIELVRHVLTVATTTEIQPYHVAERLDDPELDKLLSSCQPEKLHKLLSIQDKVLGPKPFYPTGPFRLFHADPDKPDSVVMIARGYKRADSEPSLNWSSTFVVTNGPGCAIANAGFHQEMTNALNSVETVVRDTSSSYLLLLYQQEIGGASYAGKITSLEQSGARQSIYVRISF